MSDLPSLFDVLEFWWKAGDARWYAGGEEFDGQCRDGFLDLLEHAASGGLADWEDSPSGALALLIVLDQFSRNVFRGTPRAFAQDARALAVAERAVAAGFDRAYPLPARQFFYMPYEHSEDLAVQERGCDLFRATGDQDAYYWALVHMDAIRRFGRFPHRNAILGRTTTPEEQRYLQTGGFSG